MATEVDLKEGMKVNLVKLNEKEAETSVSSSDILPIADPTTGAIKKVTVATLTQPFATGVAVATTSTVPTAGINIYRIKSGAAGAGTYTSFLSAASTPIVFETAADKDDLTHKSWQMIKPQGATYWQKDQLVNADDLGDYYTTEETDTVSLPAKKISIMAAGGSDDQVEGTSTGQYIDKTNGTLHSTAGWVSSDFIKVDKDATVTRVGHAFDNSASAATPLCFYDGSFAFVESINVPVLASQDFKVSDYGADGNNISYIRAASSTAAGIHVYIKYPINKASIDGIASTLDFATKPVQGYVDNNGTFQNLESWRRTDAVKVNDGDILYYTGATTTGTARIQAFDINMKFLQVLLAGAASAATLSQEVTPNLGIAYVIANYTKATPTKKLLRNTYVWEDLAPNLDIPMYLPPYVYGRIGTELRINPNGILAKSPLDRHLDIVWGTQLGNEKFISFTPSADLQTITLKVRGKTSLDIVGNITVKAVGTPVSPVEHRNAVVVGDSTVLCEANANIQGAWVNEVSRMLTGVGTSITPATAPAPLALNNIHFRGTLGDQPIKHEGRGGWSISNYLTLASVGSVTNAFWNPGTSQFDLKYYLLQNNWTISQDATGVDNDGSNLVIYFLCVWNSVYAQNINTFKTDLGTFLGKITSAYPLAQVKVMGLWPAPADNYRAYTDGRNLSAESVMREVVIPYSNAILSVINGNPLYEFLPIAPCFFPDDSFPTETKTLHKRTTVVATFSNDHVHPLANGYGQIADIACNNFLYCYCR